MFEYDLFIVHAEADEPFVRGHLLPAVGLAPERVMLSSELALGAIKLLEIERGVQSSRLTIVVLSPAFTADPLTELAELLAGHASGAAERLVPLLRADCALPPRLEVRASLDFRDPTRWAAEGEKLRARLERSPPAPTEVPCPYPGMRPYAADAAARFHGRAAEIDELIDRLRAGEREIYVIGPSGSGKSSLVAAGCVPRLTQGEPGLGSFLVRSMRPGERPTARLAGLLEAPEDALATPARAIEALLARRAPGTSLLIVIDQLEELFTLESADERAKFMIALRALRAARRCVVLLTLRADFFGAFMECALWTGLRGRGSRIEIAPLRGEALRAAITRPALDVGVYLEPPLTERLLADAASEPGILPLLQETLVQLWDRRQLQLLTLADYQALGDRDRSGLAIALSRRADATLRALSPAHEAIARRILLRLISFGEGRADTRRQQPRSRLRAASDDPASFERVLQQLIADRLLTTDTDEGGEASIDLAHEVMLVAWPTLAGWIQAHRGDEQRRRQLEAAAAQWVEHGRGARGLLDPLELADAEAWQDTESARALGESADVVELIAASRASHDRQRRRRRGLVGSAFAALAVFAVVVATLAVIARHRAAEATESRQRAEDDRARAEASSRESQRLLVESYLETGRQHLLEGRPQEALPYLMAAREQGVGGESLGTLIWEATRSLPLLLFEHTKSAAFSPDGTRVITVSEDHTAHVWDVATGEPLAPPLQLHGEGRLAFNPDGARVVIEIDDKTARVWDPVTSKPLTPPLQHQGAVSCAALSPDGTRVVTGSDDKTARVWDAATGRPLTPPLQHQGTVWRAAFSPDSTRVVTASRDDKAAHIWDAATGKPLALHLHQHWVTEVAFSPDGTRVVTASLDNTAHVWDAATGKPLAPPLQHQGPVLSVVFSPDGTRFVTASNDETARFWDARTGSPLATPLRHQGAVQSVAFSRDNTRVVTASGDNTARIWDAATGKPLTPPFQHQGWVFWAAFNLDGTRVLTVSSDQTARVWDTAIGQPLAVEFEHPAGVGFARFSLDGERVVTTSTDHTARVWDTATGKLLAPPLKHNHNVWRAAFSPEGARVVTASADHTARIWDVSTGQPLVPPLQHEGAVNSAAFSPDGTRVVTASVDHTARIWDAATGKLLVPPLQHPGMVTSAAFSPDGARVVTASEPDAQVWDVATGKPLGPPLHHQRGLVNQATFSPDGARVVTASWDQTARIWESATGRLLAPPLQHQGVVGSAAFSPDGTRVVTASDDQTARVWDVTTGRPLTPPLQHQGDVRSAAFSPDGTRVVTASFDHTARVWDAATGKLLAPPLRHNDKVWSATFSPDGTRILTASKDKTVRTWEIGRDDTLPAGWPAQAARSPFVLSGGQLVLRASLARGPGAR